MSDLQKADKQGGKQGESHQKTLPARLERYFLGHNQVFIFLIVFFINLVLVSPSLMPEFSMVNPDDEAKYVESGWRLLRGDIRDLAWGPIVALVYAPLHIVLGSSPDWFMLETWGGRILLFSFLWWSLLYLALQLKEYVSPYIMVGVLFIFTPFFSVIKNQSDAVFVGFSALALAFLLRFTHDRKLNYLYIGSLMVGLGALARVETAILIIIFVILAVIIGRKEIPFYKVLICAILPAACVIGIFFLVSFILVGDINLGVVNKSYDSFEMNQAVLTGQDVELVREQTRQLFGTQEENRGSILRAILRNPYAFSLRILANAKTIPENYLPFFGKKLGVVILLFAAWGVYVLRRNKAYIPMAILLIWPLHALVSLSFLSLHIVSQTIYLPLLLGSIGIAGILGKDFRIREQFVFLGMSLLVLVMSWLTKKPAFVFGFTMLVIVLILHWLIQPEWKKAHPTAYASLFLLLAAGLILREPYPYPNYAVLGRSGNEQAVYFLEKNLPPQADILVPNPLPAIAARMSYHTLEDIPPSVSTILDLWDWLKLEGGSAIVLDSNLPMRNDIYDLFEGDVSPYFSLIFTSGDGDIRIYSLK